MKQSFVNGSKCTIKIIHVNSLFCFHTERDVFFLSSVPEEIKKKQEWIYSIWRNITATRKASKHF